jgi:hypothetical protein
VSEVRGDDASLDASGGQQYEHIGEVIAWSHIAV